MRMCAYTCARCTTSLVISHSQLKASAIPPLGIDEDVDVALAVAVAVVALAVVAAAAVAVAVLCCCLSRCS